MMDYQMTMLCWTTSKANDTSYIQLSSAGVFAHFIHGMAAVLSRISFVYFEDRQVGTVFQIANLVVATTPYLFLVFGPADLDRLCSSDMAFKVSTFSHHGIHWGQRDIKEGWVLSL